MPCYGWATLQEKTGGSFLVGSKLTYADICVYCYVSFILSGIFAGKYSVRRDGGPVF